MRKQNILIMANRGAITFDGKGAFLSDRDNVLRRNWKADYTRTKAPTEQPAAREGTDPARRYPVIPPPAVRSARM